MNTLLEIVTSMVKGGTPIDEARSKLLQIIPQQEAVDAAIAEYKQRATRVRTMKEPGAVTELSDEPWYLGPQDDDLFWPSFREYLRSKRWEDSDVDLLDKSSTKVVSFLPHPGTGAFSTRGLVVGYVQSGKTANYTAVTCKGADVGFKLFIVLAGMTDALRNQTQRRLEKEIVQLNPQRWVTLTSATEDFRQTTNVNAFLGQHSGLNVLCVVKKNGPILRRLTSWLAGARPEVISACPAIIIDDEADQASPNTSQASAIRTAINKRIIEIISHLPRAAYVGYTATPFANLLINPAEAQDLYPRNFITDLPRPKHYFGPERIFGREQLDWDAPDASADGLNMIRLIAPEEQQQLHPKSASERFTFAPTLTESLRTSLEYFVLACAARYARDQVHEHSTMLIHTTQYAAVHESFKNPVVDYISQLRRLFASSDSATENRVRELWKTETQAVDADAVGETSTTIHELWRHIPAVLDRLTVKVENALSTDRIDYVEEPGQLQIVIGGNVLGRGLTLEGLLVSYFLRTASAYDTLLQMGRWFGYRRGYADLPRIWMPEELRGYFYDLATVEAEIRHDIERYQLQHITPKNFGVRIREHPHLAITAKLKMQHSVQASMSYSGEVVYTLIFHHRDEGWVKRNLQRTRAFMSAIKDAPRLDTPLPCVLLSKVNATSVCDYLGSYEFHDAQVELQGLLITDYIQAQNAKGHLLHWNVGVVGRVDEALGRIDLGLDEMVPLVNRSRFMRGNLQYADIKALMSERDVGIDITVSQEVRSAKRAKLLEARQQQWPETGLLLVYPISKDSIPLPKNNPHAYRRPLDAVDHLIGLAVIFPTSPDRTSHNYRVVNLDTTPPEEPDPDVDIEDEL